MRRAAVWALGVGLLALAAGEGSGEAPSAGLLAGSYRFERNGWIYVHLEGAPRRLGYQHGVLLRGEVKDLLSVLKPFLEHTTKRGWAFYRHAGETILWPKVDPEYQQEIDGLVEGLRAGGVEADRWDLVALNALEELPYYYVPWLDAQEGRPPTTKSPGNCSAFVATGSYTRDHAVLMAHNNWTNYVTGARWNVVFDVKPERGYRILMDGLPGVITSDDDFGVNSAGLMVTETTITGFTLFDPAGTPEFVRSRRALQYGASIDDFVRVMVAGNNGGYANDWLLADNKTGEIALFELGLKKHSVRRTKDGYFVGSNFPVDSELIRDETHFDPKNALSSPNARRVRWEQLMAEHKGRLDVGVAQALEADARDVVSPAEGPDERSLCGTVERSPRGVPEWDWGPYFPGGTAQSKVMDGRMARGMEFSAAMGHACGEPFIARDYLGRHPEYAWMGGLLKDLTAGTWTTFRSGMR